MSTVEEQAKMFDFQYNEYNDITSEGCIEQALSNLKL